MPKEDVSAAAATAAVEDAEKDADNTLTLSNGVVVRVKPLPDLLMRKLYSKFDPPEPPEVEVNSGGKTWTEPNYDDPNYENAMRKYTMTIADGIANLILLRGFEIVSKPDSIPDYEDDDTWEAELAAIGVDIPEKPLERKLTWTEYRIVETNNDLNAIQEASQRLSGISEEDVEEAQERFRGLSGQLSSDGVGDSEVGSEVQ